MTLRLAEVGLHVRVERAITRKGWSIVSNGAEELLVRKPMCEAVETSLPVSERPSQATHVGASLEAGMPVRLAIRSADTPNDPLSSSNEGVSP
jgi:hypothetical protein